MNKTLVIDASIPLSWVLKEKNHQFQIQSLLEDVGSEKVNPQAPTIWLYETLNGLKTAVLRKRITKLQATAKIPDIIEIMPQLFDFEPFLNQTFEVAVKFQLSVYDAAYIALAERENCDFYTLDKKLYKSAEGKLKFVKLISQYKTS